MRRHEGMAAARLRRRFGRLRRRFGLRAAARRTVALVVGLGCASSQLAYAAPPEPGPAASSPADAADPGADPEAGPETEPQTAGAWYARGYELGNAGDYAAAAAAFLRSYELQPTSEALFNAALAFENADDKLRAVATYERFLAEPARKEDLVDAAQRSIDAMTRELAVLKGVRFAPTRPPTQLLVQGQPIELDALPLLVLPGEIEIEVVDERGLRARETYELSAGEALVVDIRALLPALPAPEPEPALVDAGPSPAQLEAARAQGRLALRLRNSAWISLGLAGATAASAVTLAALGQREQRLFEADSCYMFEDNVCPPEFELGDPGAHQRAYGRYAMGAGVSAGLSAGLGLTSLVLALISVRYQKQATRVRLTPSIGSLSLRF